MQLSFSAIYLAAASVLSIFVSYELRRLRRSDETNGNATPAEKLPTDEARRPSSDSKIRETPRKSKGAKLGTGIDSRETKTSSTATPFESNSTAPPEVPSNDSYEHTAASFVVAFVVYVVIWNCVFSNLPITKSKMAWAVHSRFWMQVNYILLMTSGILLILAFALFPSPT